LLSKLPESLKSNNGFEISSFMFQVYLPLPVEAGKLLTPLYQLPLAIDDCGAEALKSKLSFEKSSSVAPAGESKLTPAEIAEPKLQKSVNSERANPTVTVDTILVDVRAMGPLARDH
jgi:hypothetical protein